jgi:hypothetical protein
LSIRVMIIIYKEDPRTMFQRRQESLKMCY